MIVEHTFCRIILRFAEIETHAETKYWGDVFACPMATWSIGRRHPN